MSDEHQALSAWRPLLHAAGAAPQTARVLRALEDRRLTVQVDGRVIKLFAERELEGYQREREVLRHLGGRFSWAPELLDFDEVEGLGAFVVMESLPGEPPVTGSQAVQLEVGRLAALLHDATAYEDAIEPQSKAAQIEELLLRAPLEDDFVAAVLSRVARLEAVVSRWRRVQPCLVHGDFGASNILLDSGGRGVGIVDFEDAHLGDPVDDLKWAALHGLGSMEFRSAMIGYLGVRALGAGAMARLRVAAVELAAQVMGWPGADDALREVAIQALAEVVEER